MVLGLVAAACGSVAGRAAPSSPSTTATLHEQPCRDAPVPAHYRHVVWIWMENHARSQVLGDPAAPYLTSLASGCATAAEYRSVGSPSLPNYLGATSGSTHGIADDGPPASHPLTADNLFRQVRAMGGAAVTVAEGMKGTCDLTASGEYAVKHNPAAYYVGADDRAACQRDDQPARDGAAIASRASTLPTFLFVVPDLCDDTHDCGVSRGDRWLASWLPKLFGSASYDAADTAVFVVWDEPTPMPFIAVTPSIRPGTVLRTAVDHYSLLRTTEELLGIGEHLGAAATSPSMRSGLGI